jgi:spore maturation protein CgeB
VINAVQEQNLSTLKGQGCMSLADLAGLDPETNRFAVVIARSGDPSLTIDGRYLHSTYNPRREADQLVARACKNLPETASILLLGMGMGYFAEQWLSSRPNDIVYLYEPDIDIFRHAMAARDLRKLIKHTRLYAGLDGLDHLVNDLKESGLTNGQTPTVIEWPGTKEYAGSIKEKLQQKLSVSETKSDETPLRILVVGPVYGGTLPMGQYVTRAFKELGHHVELLDYSSFDEGRKLLETLSSDDSNRKELLSELTRLLGHGVVAKAKAMRAQFVFFLAQAPGTADTLNSLRKEGIASAMWFVEDAELANWWPQVAPHYDVFFHIQGEAFTHQLENAGARYAHYLPVAADPEIHKPLDLDQDEQNRFTSDLSHVGAGYFNRRRFFLNLLKYDFKLWGNEWDDAPGLANAVQENGRRVSTSETVQIFNATRININLHSSTYTQGVNPQGDFVNPRTYELAATGAFQLVDHRSLLGDQFEAGKEVAVFHDLDECNALIDHFLAHPEEAQSMANAARERVLVEHTYTHRMCEAVQVIRQNASIQPIRNTGNTVAELTDAAHDDEELKSFLSSLGNPEDEMTLESISEEIRRRDGTLTRPEALFLLMHEFQLKAEEKGLV